MDIDELKVTIRRRANIDIEPALARYMSLAPSPTLDGLLLFLRDQRVIDTKLFTELHTADKVDATNVDPSSFALRATMQSRPPLGTNATRASGGVGDALATNVAPTPTGTHVGASPGDSGAEEPSFTESYEILGALGKGAMGAVHLARDLFLRRKVALKTILPAMQQNQALFSRFLGEMQITAQLDHPFIVPVYGLENMPNGGVGYAMKLVQGRELAELLEETRKLIEAKQPLDAEHSLEGRLEAFLKVCDALAYAHERGVVHRDLKPANIMIGKFNEVYVMDWGIARLMGKGHPGQDVGVEMYDPAGGDVRQTTRTQIGSTIGTPIYMSPEQAAGRNDELDGRSDLYSLGLVLQEIVTLKGAVGGTTLQEVLTNAKSARRIPPRPPAPGIDVPRELRAIIDKATCLKPEDRYASVAQFADDIRRYLRDESIAAQPDTSMQRAGRWVGKHRMGMIAALLLVVLIGAGATIGQLLYSRRAANQQHTRELRLAELQASSAMRAQDLDEELQHFENQLTRLGGAAALSLGEPHTGDAALHFADEFASGPRAVAGLADAAAYGMPVSFDVPVASVAPGSSKEAVLDQARAVDSLKTLARSIMLESFDPNYRTLSEADRKKALADLGVPISRISLTLESGLHVEYPGRAGLAPDYDGRKEPSYREASQKAGLTWGAPSKRKDGSVSLPCSSALRDAEGKLLGVLTFEIDPNRAVAASLDEGAAPYVESSMLVETNGNLLAQKNQAGASPEGDVLALPDVRSAMERGERGYLQTQRHGHDVLVTYQPLSTVGWYVVTIANLDLMKHTETSEGTRAGSVGPATPSSAKASPRPAQKAPPPALEPTAVPSAAASASAAESASAAPSATPPPALSGKWSDLQKAASATAAPSASAPPPPPPPPNPFDPWKAYEKK